MQFSVLGRATNICTTLLMGVWLYDICWFDHPVYQNEWFWKLKVKITLQMNKHHGHHKKIRLVLMWHWNLISVEMIIFPIYTGWEQIPTHLQCGGGEQDQQSNTSGRWGASLFSDQMSVFNVLKMCLVHCTGTLKKKNFKKNGVRELVFSPFGVLLYTLGNWISFSSLVISLWLDRKPRLLTVNILSRLTLKFKGLV